MSFSEDVVLAKFSTLTETQESIVGISQWVCTISQTLLRNLSEASEYIL